MQPEVTNAMVSGLMGYLRRRYPYTSKYTHTYQEQVAIRNGVAKWHFPVLVLQMAMLAGLTMLYAYLVHWVYAFIFHATTQPADNLYLYDWPVFCFPCFFLALATFTFPLEVVQKLLFEEKYAVYNDYYHTQKGYDGDKVKYATFRLFAIVFACIVIPFVTSFMSINATQLKVKHFYQLAPQSFALSSIKNITYDTATYDKKNVLYHSEHYQIFLKDGRYMNTTHWSFDEDSCVKALINHGIRIDSGGISKHEGNWFSVLQSDD